MKAALDADRAWRADTMVREGVGALLAGLHPQVRWRHPVLELPGAPGEDDIDFHLEGRGLLLSPHIFCGPRPRALLNDVDTPVLVYSPAAGLRPGALATAPPKDRPSDPPAALVALLGRTRAAVLHALTDPAGRTTTQLAQRLGISPSSASEHACALRTAGLATSLRRANTVRHTATRMGADLLAAAGVPRPRRPCAGGDDDRS